MTISHPLDKVMSKKNPVLMKSKHRVQKHGEVFTPQWVVDKMIAIPGIKEKTEDVFATFLEPSAGEGAFLLAIEDVKLRFATDNHSGDSWNTHALYALSSIYGIEFLEDNLAAARQNMLDLFLDYCEIAHGVPLSKQSDLYKSARAIIWANVVQGDTLTHKNNSDEEIVFSRWKSVAGPLGQVSRTTFSYSSLFGDDDISKIGVQLNLFDELSSHEAVADIRQECFAFIDIERVWKEMKDMSEKNPGKFKFDVVIGNPPYQEEATGDNTQAPPIYHKFMEEAYKIANRVSFITPARFLYNAGATPKAWNKKMLEDDHLKVEYYEHDSNKVFANTSIIGGVVVTYRDANVDFGAIETFTSFDELHGIIKKTEPKTPSESLVEIIYTQTKFNLDALYYEYPKFKEVIGSNGRDKRFRNNIFEKIDLFSDKPVTEDDIKVLGLFKNKRTFKYIPQRFVDTECENLIAYKVFVPAANGASGTLGEDSARIISTPELGDLAMGFTQSFIGVGAFETFVESEASFKYIKSKFARVLLGALKVTQHNPPETWRYVPLQDFTPTSDIDWSKMIPEIDQQLYKKYGLDKTEIDFIESHVKEME